MNSNTSKPSALQVPDIITSRSRFYSEIVFKLMVKGKIYLD
jgi:hypothetical protein